MFGAMGFGKFGQVQAGDIGKQVNGYKMKGLDNGQLKVKRRKAEVKADDIEGDSGDCVKLE